MVNNPPESGHTPVVQTPLWVIPTDVSIRQFSVTNTGYTARQFLDVSESAITNLFITEDHDKIAFIRSLLQPGSRALFLM